MIDGLLLIATLLAIWGLGVVTVVVLDVLSGWLDGETMDLLINGAFLGMIWGLGLLILRSFG